MRPLYVIVLRAHEKKTEGRDRNNWSEQSMYNEEGMWAGIQLG